MYTVPAAIRKVDMGHVSNTNGLILVQLLCKLDWRAMYMPLSKALHDAIPVALGADCIAAAMAGTVRKLTIGTLDPNSGANALVTTPNAGACSIPTATAAGPCCNRPLT